MREPGTVLLLLNGELSDPACVRSLARGCASLICADGGSRHALRLGLKPDVVIGDMDSVPKPLPRPWKETVYLCDFDDGSSDFEKALRFCAEARARRVFVAGIFGGRLDHSLVNLALARSFGERLTLVVVDRGMAVLFGPGRHRLGVKRGETFSLLAAAASARLSVSGARYPLRRAVLKPGARGLSNKASGPVVLTLHSGRVWAMAPKPFRF